MMPRKLILLSICLIITIAIMGTFRSDYRDKSFQETLTVENSDIIQITMELNGMARKTTNKAKINELIKHLNQFDYQRLRGDYTSYMPTKAPIIYFHTKDYIDFIVPYNTEVMISYKVYKVKHGHITNKFLFSFYESLNE